MVGGNNNDAFAKTICSICYEDLKPIVEDLQSISICGHVFHELCLQQWFEYCTNGKKRNCPVCKQTCSTTNVSRLYFQSVGDPNDGTLSQKPLNYEEDPYELGKEVKRLECKVLGLSSTLEQRHKELEAVNKELLIWEAKFEVESKQKTQALKEKASIQQLLHRKSEDLDKSTLEGLKLQERNMALAKELAALKLVSDVNLEEDDILKLASLGSEANNKETVDILRRSLVIRNKSYKELIAKCNTLGRKEAISQSKLDKAKEKIGKLKVRIHEMESAIEAKDNEVLRNMKASKNTAASANLLNTSRKNLKVNNNLAEDLKTLSSLLKMDVDQFDNIPQDLSPSAVKGNMKSLKETIRRGTTDTVIASNLNHNNRERDIILIDEDEDVPRTDIQPGSRERVSCSVNASSSMDNAVPASLDDSIPPRADVMPVPPLFSIRKETLSSTPVSQPGDHCFSGGLRGPDGTNWHLGKWCKKAHIKGSLLSSEGSQGSSAGDLIAVGADGRGGRIKALRSVNSSSANNESIPWTKRCKYGPKASSFQPQIENFFGRSGQ